MPAMISRDGRWRVEAGGTGNLVVWYHLLGPNVDKWVAAGFVTVAAAVALRQSWVPSTGRAWVGLPIGVLGAAGTAVFMTATQAGSLSITGVVVSLYPVFTIALSILLLRERVGRPQGLGVLLCAASIALHRRRVKTVSSR